MTCTRTMASTDESAVLRKEFYAFWNAGMRAHNFLSESASVCFLTLDEEMTLTRVFYGVSENARAEDHMIDWFYEEAIIQNASSVEINLFMNYSPLKLTVDGLITVFRNLKETGKELKIHLKFVELYNTSQGDEDAEENCEGLRLLEQFGVKIDVLKGRDWLFLVQTLTRKGGRRKLAEAREVTLKRLREILKNPRDAEVNTECQEMTQAEMMTDITEMTEAESMTDSPSPPPHASKDNSSSSSSGEE